MNVALACGVLSRSSFSRSLSRVFSRSFACVVCAAWIGCAACVVGAACVFDASAPEDARITCGGDDDCPTGLVCSPFLSTCVPISGDREAPVIVSSTLSATRLGLAGTLDVALVTDEPARETSLLQVGAVQTALLPDGGADDPLALRGSVEATALGTGVFAVSAVLVDDVGNAGAHVLGTIEVDADAPGLVADSVVVEVTQPPGTAPDADPALAVGGSIEIGLRIDDLAGDVTSVRLVSLSPADDDELEVALVARDATAFSFFRFLDVALTPGSYVIVVVTADDIGNTASIELERRVQVVGAVEGACIALTATGAPVCTDADGDGAFGIGDACGEGEATDCDDVRALVHPGAVEVADNGLDDDCDGTQDLFDDVDALFVSVDGAVGGAGTRDDPEGDLVAAVARAAGRPLYVRAGVYDIGDALLEPTGSIIGGLDADWHAGAARSVIRTSNGVVVNLLDAGPTLLQGLELTGPFCIGVVDGDATEPLLIGDVLFAPQEDDGGCIQVAAIFGNTRRIVFVDSEVRSSFVSSGDLEAVRTDGELRMVDSLVDLQSDVGAAIGIIGASDGAVVRTRFVLRGDSPTGVLGVAADFDVVGCTFDIEAVLGSFLPPVGAFTNGTVAYNTFDVVGALGAAIATEQGLVVGNVLRAGPDATAVRFEDFGAGGPRVHGNAIDVDGCALRVGRVDTTCVSIEPCDVCAASADNAEAPEVPAAVDAIALGVPTTIALDIDGDCRPALPSPGAGAGDDSAAD